MVAHHLLCIFLLLSILVPSSSLPQDHVAVYENCRKNYDCGLLGNLSYPFWGGDDRSQACGHAGFKLDCRDGEYPVLESGGTDFRVLSVSTSLKMMTLVRSDIWEDGPCQLKLVNTSFNTALLQRDKNRVLNLAYNCTRVLSPQHSFSCGARGEGVYFEDDNEEVKAEAVKDNCWVSVQVPVAGKGDMGGVRGMEGLERVLREGFNVTYEYGRDDPSMCDGCMSSGGICGSNVSNWGFACLCRDKPYPLLCLHEAHPPAAETLNVGRKVGIGLGASFLTVLIMFILFFFWLRRNKKGYAPSSFVPRSIGSDPPSKQDVEKGDEYRGVHLFTYAELEKATNNFDVTRELGDGGFGTVYYGKLQDGRVVAVKRLYENNFKRVEQFKNEVEILTRLRHHHLVSLYGCTSRHCRELLLVYEYIPNGTVADHLHGERAKPGALPWSTRMKIAVETATALAYLHASDIIHRDVKTNNILLDNNFCVKVADFGLSRPFPTGFTHVSTAPQGTPGYVDPEYHECYQLTSKSDVYSFGVVLIELISSMPAVDITRHRHEINLSNLAINKIQSDALHELVDASLGFEKDYAVRRMISRVAELAFQCLQCARDMRPCMEKVLEILKEIENENCSRVKAGKMEGIGSDDVASPVSPDTVSTKWISSSSTTASSSG